VSPGAIFDLAPALATGSARGEARELLRQGVELANRAGSQWLAWYANDRLAATGARPHRPVGGGRESLTASERRVAELAARDRTNKEIAQELFVTVKTVELHLSNVYRKLRIGSRRQLAEALELQQGEPLPASA
jgi:DNA-binding NarL/FixJ family response regulator